MIQAEAEGGLSLFHKYRERLRQIDRIGLILAAQVPQKVV